MNNECKIIQDILPLYAENIVSEETSVFVETHLVDCGICRDLLNGMKDPTDVPITLSAAPLVHLKKKMFRKRMITVLVTAAVVLSIAITGLVYATIPQYIPFLYPGERTLMGETYYGAWAAMVMGESPESQPYLHYDGELIVYFCDDITRYSVESYWSEDGMTEIYRITAWYTVLDRIIGKSGVQPLFINPPSLDEGKLIRIYYNSNDGTEDAFFYGNTLPGAPAEG
jgi:hypothetical protein